MNKTLDILDRLIAFESVSANSNLDIIEFINDYLQTRGFEVHLVASPCGNKSGLFAVLGPTDRAGIMLSAHTDVVPVTGQAWTTDPFKLTTKGSRVYGRGTTDMKGYLASVMSIADKASNTKLNEPIKIGFSYDEEIGCVGIQHMIGQLEKTIGLPRACIVGEPTQMQVAVGHKGKVALKATCAGQSGHSALAPNFVNALHIAGDFIGELRTLQDELAEHGNQDASYSIPYSTVHVGQLHGGIALNIVPDTATINFEFRHVVADLAEELTHKIKTIAQACATPYRKNFNGANIEIEQINAYPGLNVSAGADVTALALDLSQSNSTVKVAFGTEAGVFDQLGIPTVVCGPGSMQGQGHKPDEYIELDQLQACDAMMNRVLASLTN